MKIIVRGSFVIIDSVCATKSFIILIETTSLTYLCSLMKVNMEWRIKIISLFASIDSFYSYDYIRIVVLTSIILINLTFFKAILGSISTRTLVRDRMSTGLADYVSNSFRFISMICLPYLWISEFSLSLSSSLSTLLRTSLIWLTTYPSPTRVINSIWRSFSPLWMMIWEKILLRVDIILALSYSF